MCKHDGVVQRWECNESIHPFITYQSINQGKRSENTYAFVPSSPVVCCVCIYISVAQIKTAFFAIIRLVRIQKINDHGKISTIHTSNMRRGTPVVRLFSIFADIIIIREADG